jgi:hypothetical protein
MIKPPPMPNNPAKNPAATPLIPNTVKVSSLSTLRSLNSVTIPRAASPVSGMKKGSYL